MTADRPGRGAGTVAADRVRWRGAATARVAAVVATAVATAALAVVADDVGLVLAPALVLAALWVMITVPLRFSCSVMLFLLLAVDDFSTAQGRWHSPLAIVNEVLIQNVDRVIPAARGFKLSGLELATVLLLAVAWSRRAARSGIDGVRAAAPRELRDILVLYLAGICFAVVNGLLHGGTTEIAIWQARPLLHVALLVILFEVAYRGAEDAPVLGRVVVAAALCKTALAVWVRQLFDGIELNYATNHGDSILFTAAVVVLVADLMERTDRTRFWRCALLVPPILCGVAANNRRLAWVQLGFALSAMFALSSWRLWKRTVARAAVAMAPVVLLYVVIGWSSPSGVFGPVKLVRSVVDTKRDRSSYDRHVENWNLVLSMQERPILGRGMGLEWTEYWKTDEITHLFPQYKAEPHNQVLGLLLFCGLAAFTAVWSLYATAAYFAARAYHAARTPASRALALVCLGAVASALVQAYGDLGPYWIQFKVAIALATVLAGKTLLRANQAPDSPTPA